MGTNNTVQQSAKLLQVTSCQYSQQLFDYFKQQILKGAKQLPEPFKNSDIILVHNYNATTDAQNQHKEIFKGIFHFKNSFDSQSLTLVSVNMCPSQWKIKDKRDELCKECANRLKKSKKILFQQDENTQKIQKFLRLSQNSSLQVYQKLIILNVSLEKYQKYQEQSKQLQIRMLLSRIADIADLFNDYNIILGAELNAVVNFEPEESLSLSCFPSTQKQREQVKKVYKQLYSKRKPPEITSCVISTLKSFKSEIFQVNLPRNCSQQILKIFYQLSTNDFR